MEEEFGVGQGKRDARGGGRPERRFAVPSGTLEAIRNGGRVIDLADQDQPGGGNGESAEGAKPSCPSGLPPGGMSVEYATCSFFAEPDQVIRSQGLHHVVLQKGNESLQT